MAEYTLQGNYGESAGWEDLTSEDTLDEIKERLGDYVINEQPYTKVRYRVVDENGSVVDTGTWGG